MNTTLDDSLHQGRSVNTAQNTVGNACSRKYLFAVSQLIRDHQISDPLSRKRQALAERIPDHRVRIKFCHKWDLYPIICQFPIRLIRDQNDAGSKFLLFFLQDIGYVFQSFSGIYHTGWIIWRIDDHRLCLFVDLLLKFL